MEEFIERLVIARLSRPDAAGLVAVPEGGPDVAALREEAAAIRRNLGEMAADRALGLIDRAQLLAATARANKRLGEIEDDLAEAARENVLAPMVAAENAAAVWEALDLSRKRAVIKTLMTITLHSRAGVPAARSTRPRSRSPGGRKTRPELVPAGRRQESSGGCGRSRARRVTVEVPGRVPRGVQTRIHGVSG